MKTIEKPAVKEHKVTQVKLKEIIIDGGTQSRADLDNDTAEEYAEAMRNGAKFPHMEIFHGVDDRTPDDPTKRYWMSRGFHRWHAYDKNGTLEEWCKVYEGSRRDAILHSVSDNAKHGLQRNNEDKNFCVRLLLEDEEWWEKSNIWVGEQCHVGEGLVAKVRKEMEEEWRLEEEREASLRAARSENGAVTEPSHKKRRGNRSRKGRSRHGGTRTINTTNIGKDNGKSGYRERPVYPNQYDAQKDPQAHAAKLVQLARSRKKHARQSLEAGESEDQAVAAFLEARRSIPVEK